jgi:hypothetical protein
VAGNFCHHLLHLSIVSPGIFDGDVREEGVPGVLSGRAPSPIRYKNSSPGLIPGMQVRLHETDEAVDSQPGDGDGPQDDSFGR